ncbi:sugar ABC transporter permease [Streptomyces pactum]|uniref:sugar ABC transporter permease n=1 Tax=Streptomyces pactum TaxID=68249 RepID=UPI0006E23B00
MTTPASSRAGNRGDGRLAAVFVAPALLGFAVFGLDNHVRMVHDPIFWDSLRTTVVHVVVNIGVQTVSALTVAVPHQRLTPAGIVFPATPGGTEAAVAACEKTGIDVSAVIRPVGGTTEFRTFTYPVTDHAAGVPALMWPAMRDVYGGGEPVSSLDETNDQIDLTLEQ